MIGAAGIRRIGSRVADTCIRGEQLQESAENLVLGPGGKARGEQEDGG